MSSGFNWDPEMSWIIQQCDLQLQCEPFCVTKKGIKQWFASEKTSPMVTHKNIAAFQLHMLPFRPMMKKKRQS